MIIQVFILGVKLRYPKSPSHIVPEAMPTNHLLPVLGIGAIPFT